MLDKTTELGCCRRGCFGDGRRNGGLIRWPKERRRPKNIYEAARYRSGEKVRSIGLKLKAQHNKGTMPHRVLSLAGRLRAVTFLVWLLAAAMLLPLLPAAAQNAAPPQATDQQAAPGPDGASVDEYAEAQRVLNGPAGNPECVWLGSRVVSLLLRDDLDTAFRHLDLYDRFGCPSGHVQAAFRCLVLHQPTISADPKSADPKSADSLNGRVHACWINPSMQAAAAPAPSSPAAAAASQTSTH
jgi:hypothetical protein